MYVTRKYYQISSLGSIRGEARSERDFSSTQRGEGITSSFSLECSTRGIEFLPGFVLDRLWLSRPRSEERGSLHDLLLGGWNKPTTHGRTRCIVGSHLPCCKRYLTGVTECHLLLHQNSVSLNKPRYDNPGWKYGEREHTAGRARAPAHAKVNRTKLTNQAAPVCSARTAPNQLSP